MKNIERQLRKIKTKTSHKSQTKEPKTCVECKYNPANYWGDNFCEDCFKRLIGGKYRGE